MKAPDNRLLFGRGGSGKSHLVKHWLKRYRGRLLIHDVAAEPDYAAIADVVTDSFVELVGAVVGREARVLAFRGLSAQAWEDLNRLAWAWEDCLVVWEEVDQWYGPGVRPPHAFRLINQGRHRRVRIIACSRRPARVSRDFTANASRIVAFHTKEPRDVAYLAEWMGEGAAAALPALEPYTALDWRGGEAVVRKSPFA
jgi:hypothetical protein